jgi:epoxyqueuosine reductase QueG
VEKEAFESALGDFARSDSGNYIAQEIALRPELAGMMIFGDPVFGYAAASDPLFGELKKPEAIGDHCLLPGEWLGGARTVISVFLPFAQEIKKANGADTRWPADEWLHARIEGQEFQKKICRFGEDLLAKEGLAAVAPMIDPRLSSGHPHVKDKSLQAYYTSNWSERHVAYICGIGTFGLSGGLITSRGIAFRFVSFVTAGFFEPDRRPYAKIDEYCARCGACARNCPAGAISAEKGKAHFPCSAFLDRVMEKCAPRYGCGKCQVKVPCESGIPVPVYNVGT